MNPHSKSVQDLPIYNPAFAELATNIADRKPAEPKGRMWLKSFDAFGTQPKFGWNSKGSYQTKVGSMCTALCVFALGFVAYGYFEDFILCLEPNVSTKTLWGPIEKDAPHNDLNLIMAPGFRAIHYKLVPDPTTPGISKYEQESPSSEVLACHFNIYATVETNHDVFISKPLVKVPLKRDCDSTWDKWTFLKGTHVTRHLMSDFQCFDIPKMPIYGDLPWCS